MKGNIDNYTLLSIHFCIIIIEELKRHQVTNVPSAREEVKVQSWRKKQIPSQREQYGSTVHLFIGTGRSPCKFTFMPFTLGSNSIVIHRGPNSLFIFKSVSFSATTPKLSRSHLRRCINLRIILVCCDIDLSSKIPVHTLYSRNTVKSCFWGPS
jgi:hypothetical protein